MTQGSDEDGFFDAKTCIFAQFGSCHENVTQIAENGGKSAANDNK
jgi:hypothetical protein